MGCTTSKQSRRSPPAAPFLRRRSSGAAVHAGGQNHVVVLTSSTLGSLNLDYMSKNAADDEFRRSPATEMAERGVFSSRPASLSGEPEVIDYWELMEGLDDDVASRSSNLESEYVSSKIAPGTSSDFDAEILSSNLDPEILSCEAIDEESVSPENEHCEELHSLKKEESVPNWVQESTKSIVRARIEAFQQKIDAKRAKKNEASLFEKVVQVVGGKGKVVVYFTSLRGVRKTFEDCWTVRVILKSYGFRIDERDVSMHSGFKDELVQMLGSVHGRGQLPRVFAGGRYLGGADEVRQLHEAGELFRKLEGCEMMAVNEQKGRVEVECQGCGDVRFVPCEACSGSCKLYVEEEGDFVEFGSFRRCPDCNENGLVRCPLCCY